MSEMDSVTRRSALAAAAVGVGAAALGGSDARAQAQARKTFVLIHGAYHGGWCWRRVADLLEAKGHKVYAPSLTGCGDRMHLLNKDVNLETTITDVVNIFKYEDIKDACLVPHSFGGWAASGALEQIGDRVSSIVWLDAFKPEDGQKGTDYISPFSKKALDEATARGELSRKPPQSKQFGVNEKDQPWIDSKLTPQPNAVALQAIKLTGAVEKVAKKTFIRAPRYKQAAFDRAFEQCKANKGWQTFAKETSGHDVMVDEPQWLADVLLKVS